MGATHSRDSSLGLSQGRRRSRDATLESREHLETSSLGSCGTGLTARVGLVRILPCPSEGQEGPQPTAGCLLILPASPTFTLTPGPSDKLTPLECMEFRLSFLGAQNSTKGSGGRSLSLNFPTCVPHWQTGLWGELALQELWTPIDRLRAPGPLGKVSLNCVTLGAWLHRPQATRGDHA